MTFRRGTRDGQGPQGVAAPGEADLLWAIAGDIDGIDDCTFSTAAGAPKTVCATEQHYQAQMIVEDEKFNVHSLVLIPESAVFLNMFTAPPDTPDPIAS